MVDSKDNECSFNKNGGCLFYDNMIADIDECLILLGNVIPFTRNIMEAMLILQRLKERE